MIPFSFGDLKPLESTGRAATTLLRDMMNKKLVRILTDVALWFLFSFMLGTGLLIHFRLVAGSEGGHGLQLWGMTRHEWGELHTWAAYAFLGFLVIHLFLNLSFIKNVIAKRMKWRLGLLAAGSICIVGLLLLAPVTRDSGGGGHGHGREKQSTE